MIQYFIQRALKSFVARPKKDFHELSDWMLAVVGALSFLAAGYGAMAVTNILPDLINLTNQRGLTPVKSALFLFLGGLGVAIWFLGCVAARCHSVLYERHFR